MKSIFKPYINAALPANNDLVKICKNVKDPNDTYFRCVGVPCVNFGYIIFSYLLVHENNGDSIYKLQWNNKIGFIPRVIIDDKTLIPILKTDSSDVRLDEFLLFEGICDKSVDDEYYFWRLDKKYPLSKSLKTYKFWDFPENEVAGWATYLFVLYSKKVLEECQKTDFSEIPYNLLKLSFCINPIKTLSLINTCEEQVNLKYICRLLEELSGLYCNLNKQYNQQERYDRDYLDAFFGGKLKKLDKTLDKSSYKNVLKYLIENLKSNLSQIIEQFEILKCRDKKFKNFVTRIKIGMEISRINKYKRNLLIKSKKRG